MSTLLVLIIVIGAVVFVLTTLKGKKRTKERNPIKGKRILTMNEQPTF